MKSTMATREDLSENSCHRRASAASVSSLVSILLKSLGFGSGRTFYRFLLKVLARVRTPLLVALFSSVSGNPFPSLRGASLGEFSLEFLRAARNEGVDALV